ncbi:MAG: hypothetical protein WCY19_08235 [Candidatus Gastranaerophilaceae bacterium]
MARGVQLLQQTLETNFRRFMNFLGFARGFLIRKNPLKAFLQEFAETIKDFLTMNKKLKMSRYRLNYHRHQLQRMESLIAENNEHTFLRGKNINEVR